MLTIPLPGLEYKIYNLGKTKNEVRQQIAFAVYEFLKTNKLLYNIKDEIGKPNIETAINQLQELYQKGYIEQPQYEFHCLEKIWIRLMMIFWFYRKIYGIVDAKLKV